jgi:hypothetical protein
LDNFLDDPGKIMGGPKAQKGFYWQPEISDWLIDGAAYGDYLPDALWHSET